MDRYEALRHFADSWGLAFLTVLFVAIMVWAFRPGSRAKYDDAAQIPLRDRMKERADD